jgi:histidine triad (HIT) family protein
MSNCIFCKIIRGDEPERTIIFETATVLVIKPRTEINPGHALVIPKQHFVDLSDIPEDAFNQVAEVSRQMAKLLQEKYKSSGTNILHASGKDAGQSVFHFHIHVVPRFESDGLDLWLKRNL